jgi:hypothetical protein
MAARSGRRERKVPFNCYLSVSQLDALDVASEREGRPRAELVREAVEIYLAGRAAEPAESLPGNAPETGASSRKSPRDLAPRLEKA